MTKKLFACSLLVALVAFPLAATDPPDKRMPRHSEEIYVLGDAPFVHKVPPGQPVHIVFGVGDLDVTAEDVDEIRAYIELRCKKLSDERCQDYRRRLRIEPRQTERGLEIRMVGLRKGTLRRMGVDGRVVVPRSSPLSMKVGIGDVDVDAGPEDVSVRMGIGDLTVRAPHSAVGSVKVGTRIGDASIRRTGDYMPGKRRMLIGAKLRWNDGPGSSRIELGLRIGDSKVILE